MLRSNPVACIEYVAHVRTISQKPARMKGMRRRNLDRAIDQIGAGDILQYTEESLWRIRYTVNNLDFESQTYILLRSFPKNELGSATNSKRFSLNRFSLQIALLISVLLLTSCQNGPAVDPTTLFTDYQGENTPGAAVLVIKKGKVAYEGLFGMADLGAKTPVESSTNFRLASVTKQFTAMSIMMLIERNQLTLDTSLSDVFPAFAEFAEFADHITIQNLLQHTSGLIDYESLIPDTATIQVHDKDVLALLQATDSTVFPPGSAYAYSNSGYSVLAMIVEELTSTSFPQFLEQNIFEPLGMNQTVAFVDGISTIENRAFGYSVESNGFAFADQSLTSAVLGDGGIYSSLDDLMKWDQALYTDSLVSFEMLQQAFTPGLESYGFGWRIADYNGHLRYSHTGSTSGFRNVIQRYPDDQLTIIILTNRNDPVVEPLADELAELFF